MEEKMSEIIEGSEQILSSKKQQELAVDDHESIK